MGVERAACLAELGRVWWSQCLTFRGCLGVDHMVMLETRMSTFWDSAGQGGELQAVPVDSRNPEPESIGGCFR